MGALPTASWELFTLAWVCGGVVIQVWGTHDVWGGWPAAHAGGRSLTPSPAAPGTQDGRTPLHRAADNGHKDVAALLLERGANNVAKAWVSRPRVGVGRGWMG